MNNEARLDLAAWLIFLQSFNGVSVLLDEHWISSEKLELFTDASNHGFAGVLKGKWFQGGWPSSWEQKHITIKELFPIVLALKMWSSHLRDRRLLILYDNQSVVCIINSQFSVHKVNGFADPTSAFVIKKLLHGASKLRPSVDYRAPVTKEILHSLVRSAPHITDCFYNNTLVCSMYLLDFHGFLRIGEIVVSSVRKAYVVLQVDQVTVNQSECVIVFHSYKHYQGHPVSLVISPSADADVCPVKYMQRYLSLRGSAPGPLFVFSRRLSCYQVFLH